LQGALALTPSIFTLTIFNRTSRNNVKFWRPLAYIPNLGYGKNKADKTPTKDKVHMSMSVFLLHSNQLDESIVREGSGHWWWAGK
jgi:hypothetical protein